MITAENIKDCLRTILLILMLGFVAITCTVPEDSTPRPEAQSTSQL